MKRVFALMLLLVPGIAFAAGNDQGKQDKKHDGMICRDLDTTGSRLETRRVCMTREQWEQQRHDARELIDRAQNQQTNPKGG
jgi:nicotinamide mononucleotide (NMN) deamidase PncC